MFASCLSPRRVYNRFTGEYVTASCGRCEYCRKHRRDLWARRIQIHSQHSAYVLFFTLSYDNSHLPLIHYDNEGFATAFEHTTERLVFNRHTKKYKSKVERLIEPLDCTLNVFQLDPIPHFDDHGDYIEQYITPPHYVRQRIDKNNFIYDESNSFAICYSKDIQDFFKRCRSRLGYHYRDCSFDPSFTYFAVSEYGGQTYRPHFHGLLFFRSFPPDVSTLLSLLSSCWKKSPSTKVGKQFEPVRDKTKSAKYVSKYVCKDTTLPAILTTPEFCTKSFKSVSIPLGSESFDIKDIPTIFSKGTLLYESEYYDKVERSWFPCKLSHPECSWRRVFPKLVGQRLLSTLDLRRIFCRIFEYKRNPGSLPNYVKEFPLKYPVSYLSETIDDKVVDEYIDEYYLCCPHNPVVDSFGVVPRRLLYGNNDSSVRYYDLTTFSSFIPRLIRDDLDFYLFGIPQNRAFCRKILRCANEYDFLSDPLDYLSYFKWYHALNLSDSIRFQHESFDELRTPEHFASIYPDFYDDLPYSMSVASSDELLRIELILSNFGFCLDDFYDAHCNKIHFDFSLPRLLFSSEVLFSEKGYKTVTIYNEQYYGDS